MSGNYHVVGKNVQKLDGVKLVTGQPCFADDVQPRGMLHGRILGSPHAHAEIEEIDVSEALALPGVHVVLTHHHTPRVAISTAGQNHPEPSPWDHFILDRKVRHVGDRVAAVAAETPQIAERALRLIRVKYKVLPAVLDPEAALREGAPVVHDEPEITNVKDASRNLAGEIDVQVGNVEEGFQKAPRDRRETSTACRGYSIAAWRPTCPSDTSTRTTGSSCGPARRCPSTPAGRWPRPFRSPRPASA